MQPTRTTGNRRSNEELEKIKIDLNKLTFELEEQKNFKGTKEQLEMMQAFERAYIDGAPLISDEEWDILKTKHNYQESLTSTAPSGRTWVKMMAPLPSLEKAGNLEELIIFLDRFPEGTEFKAECKLDGLSANVRYKKFVENDGSIIYKLECITSRGNGRYGLKLNPYALSGVRTNWPEIIEGEYVEAILRDYTDDKNNIELPEYFELRGEAVIPKNEHSYTKYGENSVWRNIASGMFNRKVPFNLIGLIDYLYEGKETIESLCGSDGYIIFKPVIEGRKCINPDVLEKASLIASLFAGKDSDKFLRGDEVRIDKDHKVTITHKNGNVWSGYDDGEELDIVFYSCSINGANIDTEKLEIIPDIKCVSEIEYQKNISPELANQIKDIYKVYRITKDKDCLRQAIFDFYGTDKNGKRDLSLHRLRNLYEYAMDGVVFKPVNSNKETQGLEMRNHKNNAAKILIPKYPEDQIACKLLSEMVRVKLEKIEKNTTDLNNVTCSGILDKPYLTESGAMVERINLHNPEWLEQNSWIEEGKEYWMILSMDIIPVLLDPNMM